MRPALALLPALAAMVVAGCGGGGTGGGHASPGPAKTVTTTRVQVVQNAAGNGFDPATIYRRDGASVVTVVSIFPAAGGAASLFGGGGAQAGQGSGFVISPNGEIATNAHVVTNGEGGAIQRARQVFVEFGDGNRVSAHVVGFDPNADVALIKVDPSGLSLRPLQFADSRSVQVGAPVAAIGSPFDQEQSLSVGVVSAKNRSIDSLTGFQINGAIQTDAAINHGNSGGPLLDAEGHVLGINSQIKSSSGGGEGVGFAVPADLVKRSLDQLRSTGRVRYAYLGVETAQVYPQLGRRFNLGTISGAWVQKVVPGGPAAKGGIRGPSGPVVRFQFTAVRAGGDVIVGVDGRQVRTSDDLATVLQSFRPGQQVTIQVVRSGKRRTVQLTLGERPSGAG